jgi:LysR family hydrogen peroxide-inducible transcriptional activator
VNIHQLEYILAVNQFNSFSKAADYCHVTQATLSAMVKKLEEELNIVIFDRKTSPISTTKQGLEIILQAQQVVSHAQKLVASAKTRTQKLEGRMKVGIIPTIACSVIPMIAKHLTEKYPLLVLEIYELTTNQLIRDLREGKLDVGILSTPIAAHEMDTQVLFEEELQVYGYVDTPKKIMLKSALANQKIFLLQEGHCLRDQIIQLCELKKNKSLPSNLMVESNTFETLLNLVDVFKGMTVLPSLYINQLSPERKSNLITLSDGQLHREVSLCYYKPYANLPMIQLFGQELKQRIQPFLNHSN